MKIKSALLFLAFFILTAEKAPAENNKPESPKLKPGMETVVIGDAKILVPRGTKVYKEGDVIKVEDLSEYSARNFKDTEERFNKLQAEFEIIKKEIELLKEAVAGITVNRGPGERNKEAKPE